LQATAALVFLFPISSIPDTFKEDTNE